MSARTSAPGSAYLVDGADEVIVANEIRSLLAELVGDRDPTLVVEEQSATELVDGDPRPIVDAFMTPPFLIDRRIVVVRRAGSLGADAARSLATAIAERPDGAILVLAGDGGTVTPTLKKAVAAAGEVISVGVKSFNDKKAYVAEQLRTAPVRLSAKAVSMLKDHVGEDLGRIAGLLETLASAYGTDVTVDPEMLEPYLGQLGQVPPWELTDRVEAGEVGPAVAMVDRMLGPGGSSAHVIVVLLERRFHALALLDGANVRSADEAATVAGVAPFVAKKLFSLSNRLSRDAIDRAIGLVAQADLDLKGDSGLEDRLIIEILVARLARICGTGR